MINLKKKDSLSDAVKSIVESEDKLKAKLINTVVGDKPEETEARKSIKATGGEPLEQPKVGLAKEESEQLDELKKSTLASYAKKATDDVSYHSFSAGSRSAKDPERLKDDQKAMKRQAGVSKAVDRLTKEDTEQLDELKKSTIKSYIKKKHDDMYKTGAPPSLSYVRKTMTNLQRAHDRNTGVKPTSEQYTLKAFKERYEEFSIYDQMIQEVLSKDASAGAWIHDFVHSDNPKFAGKSKEQRKKQALAAYYAKQRNEEVEQVDEKVDTKKKTMDTLGGRVAVPADTQNQHTETKVKLNSEGWDDMMKAVKERNKPQPSGGSGVKAGSRYGGSKQKDTPEEDEDKKKVTESKRPESDDVPFDPPFNTTSRPADVTDKSGAKHTPMSRARHLARFAMDKIKKDLSSKK
jgi:organic radical activating enzyme